MIGKYKIRRLQSTDFSSDVWSVLVSIDPRGVKNYPRCQSWETTLDDDDFRIQEIDKILASAGWRKRYPDEPIERNTYTVVYYLEYCDDDLRQAELLSCAPDELDANTGWSVSDTIQIDAETADTACDITSALSRDIVPNRVRTILERADLVGLQFSQIQFVNSIDGKNSERTVLSWGKREPWWELGSSVRMPPVSPKIPKLHMSITEDRVVDRYTDEPVRFKRARGPMKNLPGVYLRTELEKIGPFDIAETFERSSLAPRSFGLIVSQRFRQAWISAGLDGMHWIPVTIDEDDS